MKRYLTVLIAACLLAATGIAGAQNAPNATPASDFKYDLTDDADGVVIKSYIGNAAEVVIPAEIEDFPVLELAYGCFKDCAFLQKVVLPKTLKTIGKYAFSETGLESLSIPDSVRDIGERAFAYCRKLKTVTFSAGIECIADFAFLGCSALKTIILPKNLKIIGDCAFSGTGLESLSIPDSVRNFGEIEGGAFASCENLKTVTLGKGIKNTGRRTFADCTALKAVTFSAGIECIDWAAFSGCSALKTIILPDSIKAIHSAAFQEAGLEAIVIPDSVEGIWREAFKDCKNLKTVTIGNGIKAIENSAFKDCSSLTTVNIGVKEFPEGEGYDDVFNYGHRNYFADLPWVNFARYAYGYGNAVFSGCSALNLKEKKKLKDSGYTDPGPQHEKRI